MRQTLATLATLACARAWPALDEALAAYPMKHAAAVAKLEKGQDAKVVLVGAHHGLGNREHALLSSFALALATDAALFVDWGARPRLPADEKGDQPLRRPAHALHVRPDLPRRAPGRAVRARVHRRVQATERVLAPPRRLRVDAHRPQHAEGSSGKAPGREMN